MSTKPSCLENRLYASAFIISALVTVLLCACMESYTHGAVDQQAYDAKRRIADQTRAEQFLTDYTLNVARGTDEARRILAQEGK